MTATKARRASAWRPILPVPEDAPPPRFSHHVRGDPRRIFHYRDPEGRTLGYVCSFLRSAGGTQLLTLTWCLHEDESRAWQWIQFPSLRPMFGAERLDEERSRLVLVVADELAAETLHPSERMVRGVMDAFAAYDVVSWTGGRSKLGDVDWSPLRGRFCTIWLPNGAESFRVAKGDPQSGELIPIERQPWRLAARRLSDSLKAFGAIPLTIVETPALEDLPDGFGPVEMLDSGMSRADLNAWMLKHSASRTEVEKVRALNTAQPFAVAAVNAAPGDWTKTLLRKDGTGPLLSELHNVRKIFANHEAWKGVIYLDEYAHAVRKAKPPPFEGGVDGEWSDTDDTMAADWFAHQCQMLKLRTSLVAEAVQATAKLHGRNPLVDYLRGLKWDRRPRLDQWLRALVNAGPFLPDMSGADAERLDRYLSLVGRLWLLGAVKRALSPGCKFDYVLILEGLQGLGKSNVFRVLGGDWAMDSPLALGDKEGMETIRGKWIIEIPELDSLNKVESSIAKSFFSRTTDRFRLPYAKRSVDFKRACAFGGTTNESEYLRDPTGDRRYWPVYVDRRGYDWSLLEQGRDQLLAEAVSRVLAGERTWPTREEEMQIRVEQRKRQVLDPWMSMIDTWTRNPDAESLGKPVTAELIMRRALHIEINRMDERGMRSRVGRALHRLGYDKVEDKTLAERFRYEKRPAPEEGDR